MDNNFNKYMEYKKKYLELVELIEQAGGNPPRSRSVKDPTYSGTQGRINDIKQKRKEAREEERRNIRLRTTFYKWSDSAIIKKADKSILYVKSDDKNKFIKNIWLCWY